MDMPINIKPLHIFLSNEDYTWLESIVNEKFNEESSFKQGKIRNEHERKQGVAKIKSRQNRKLF